MSNFTKPPSGYVVATQNTLAAGLVSALPCLETSGTTTSDLVQSINVPVYQIINNATYGSGMSSFSIISTPINVSNGNIPDFTIMSGNLVVGSYSGSNNGPFCGLYFSNSQNIIYISRGNNQINFQTGGSQIGSVTDTSFNYSSVAQPYYINYCITYSSGTYNLYNSGVLVGSSTINASTNGLISLQPFAHNNGGDASTTVFTYLWNRVLSTDEITSITSSPYQFLAQAPSGANPSIGTASILSVTASQINLKVVDVVGGNTPITYQWYRGTVSNFVASPSTILMGLTSDIVTDTPPNNSTYYYCCVATDAAQRTSTSNIIGGAINSNGGTGQTASAIALVVRSYLAPQLAMIRAIYPQTNSIPTNPASVGSAMTISNTTIAQLETGIIENIDSNSVSLQMILSKVNLVNNFMPIDLTMNVPMSNTSGTLGDCFNAARAQGFGKWIISGNNLNLYGPDNTTIVHSFTLDNPSSPTSRS